MVWATPLACPWIQTYRGRTWCPPSPWTLQAERPHLGGLLLDPQVAPSNHGHFGACATEEEDLLHECATRVREGFVDRLFQRDFLAPAHALVRGEHPLAVHVHDAVAQRVCAKAANTTECGAPMRAQASMTKAVAGIMGM